MSTTTMSPTTDDLSDRLFEARRLTLELAAPSSEDMVVQAMPDASPDWARHLARHLVLRAVHSRERVAWLSRIRSLFHYCFNLRTTKRKVRVNRVRCGAFDNN